MVMGANPLDQFYYTKAELRKKKIPRLVILEEFDLIQNQSVFKTLLDAQTARESVCVLTTNHYSEIEEAIISRCAVYHFGRESELWMNQSTDKPAGCREQVIEDLMLLMRRVLIGEIKKSKRDVIDSDETIIFFQNIIHAHYPSVRECLTNARKYIRRGELVIPARLQIPVEE